MPVPVIDTNITGGKAITTQTGIRIAFQPTASNAPTSWTSSTVPSFFTFDTATGLMTGYFKYPGLYGIVLIATNGFGDSNPATFYFLVEQGSAGSIAAQGGYGLDIWIDIQNGGVSITPPGENLVQQTQVTTNGSTTTTQVTSIPVPVVSAIIKVKRGDTLPLTVRFHKHGIPVSVPDLTSLKFGVRQDFDTIYAILTDDFTANDDGSFSIIPNYSDNTEINFEIQDVEDFIVLKAEVQWETTPEGMDVTRRSSETFDNRIYQDIIQPN